jgi:hypothetical protein
MMLNRYFALQDVEGEKRGHPAQRTDRSLLRASSLGGIFLLA